jgi:hypothetical protein
MADELLTYLKGNRDYLHQFLQAELDHDYHDGP